MKCSVNCKHTQGTVCLLYNRLCFGVNSAVSIFQRIMENLMKDLNVVIYLDDLLVMGGDEREHLMNLDSVLLRLQENGLRVKESKCEFGIYLHISIKLG